MTTWMTMMVAWLTTGLVLMAGWLLFRLGRLVMERSSAPASSRQLLRFGQAVLAACLLVPVVVACWPASWTQRGVELGRVTEKESVEPMVGEPANEGAPATEGILATPAAGTTSSQAVLFSPARARAVALGLTLVLLGGVLLRGLLTLRSWLHLRRVIQSAVTFRCRGRVTIVASDAMTVPFSTRVLGRAHVVLPVRLLGEPEDLRLALLHELQHHRVGDPAWAIGLETLRLVFWWNPAAWTWSRDLGQLQELACDEAVVARRVVEPSAYASCLVRVAEQAVAEPAWPAVSPMASPSEKGTAGGRFLKTRIERSLGERTRSLRPGWLFTAAVIASMPLVSLAQVMEPVGARLVSRLQASATTAMTRSPLRTERRAVDPVDHAQMMRELRPFVSDTSPIYEIERACGRAGMAIERITPRRARKVGPVRIHPVKVQGTATIRSVGLLVSRLHQINRLVVVDPIEFRFDMMNPSERARVELVVSFILAAEESDQVASSLLTEERLELARRLREGTLSRERFLAESERLAQDEAQALTWDEGESSPALREAYDKLRRKAETVKRGAVTLADAPWPQVVWADLSADVLEVMTEPQPEFGEDAMATLLRSLEASNAHRTISVSGEADGTLHRFTLGL
ncbi:MAG: M56 family metallopeptidase [Acidobacteriota bacterium]